jgi:hypothetical protein
MSGANDVDALLDEVALTFAPLAVVLCSKGDSVVADLAREDGTIL